MLQKVKQNLKNQRGLTLIELLAVIVILGIIAAIAVPSIGGIIDNSKKDAHVANAQQMISSTKIAVTSNRDLHPADGSVTYVPLAYLEAEGYIETVTDPDGGTGYVKGVATAPVAPATFTTTVPAVNTSYVQITNTGGQFTYEVTIYGSDRNIPLTTEANLKRSVVADN